MRKNSILTLLAVMVLTAYAVLWFATNTGMAQAAQLAAKQFNSFSYTISSSTDSQASINVKYNTQSVANLNAYKSEAAQISSQYAVAHSGKIFVVDITFNRPLTIDEYQKFVTSYNLTAVDFAIRTVTTSGQRGTISGSLENSQTISAEEVNSILNTVQKHNSVKMLGVISSQVKINGNKYKALATDNNVYLVNALRSYLTDEATRLKPSLKASQISYYNPDPYWYLENFGLVTP